MVDKMDLSEFIDYMGPTALAHTIRDAWNLIESDQADSDPEEGAPTVIRMCWKALVTLDGLDKAKLTIFNWVQPDRDLFMTIVNFK